jgi:hypothetical protein
MSQLPHELLVQICRDVLDGHVRSWADRRADCEPYRALSLVCRSLHRATKEAADAMHVYLPTLPTTPNSHVTHIVAGTSSRHSVRPALLALPDLFPHLRVVELALSDVKLGAASTLLSADLPFLLHLKLFCESGEHRFRLPLQQYSTGIPQLRSIHLVGVDIDVDGTTYKAEQIRRMTWLREVGGVWELKSAWIAADADLDDVQRALRPWTRLDFMLFHGVYHFEDLDELVTYSDGDSQVTSTARGPPFVLPGSLRILALDLPCAVTFERPAPALERLYVTSANTFSTHREYNDYQREPAMWMYQCPRTAEPDLSFLAACLRGMPPGN